MPIFLLSLNKKPLTRSFSYTCSLFSFIYQLVFLKLMSRKAAGGRHTIKRFPLLYISHTYITHAHTYLSIHSHYTPKNFGLISFYYRIFIQFSFIYFIIPYISLSTSSKYLQRTFFYHNSAPINISEKFYTNFILSYLILNY